MRLLKRLISIWTVLLIMIILSVPVVYASPMPDLDESGSITIIISCEGRSVSSGSVTLYRIASLNEAFDYVLEPEFRASRIDVTQPLTADSAKALASYAQQQQCSGHSVALDREGKAVFGSLQTGLYLVVQWEAGAGYLPVNPFFVNIPQQIDGELFYDVTAYPKTAPEPTIPTDPTEPDPTVPSEPKIPQTGQLNWPIPVMAAMGICFFGIGCVLCTGHRRKTR